MIESILSVFILDFSYDLNKPSSYGHQAPTLKLRCPAFSFYCFFLQVTLTGPLLSELPITPIQCWRENTSSLPCNFPTIEHVQQSHRIPCHLCYPDHRCGVPGRFGTFHTSIPSLKVHFNFRLYLEAELFICGSYSIQTGKAGAQF